MYMFKVGCCFDSTISIFSVLVLLLLLSSSLLLSVSGWTVLQQQQQQQQGHTPPRQQQPKLQSQTRSIPLRRFPTYNNVLLSTNDVRRTNYYDTNTRRMNIIQRRLLENDDDSSDRERTIDNNNNNNNNNSNSNDSSNFSNFNPFNYNADSIRSSSKSSLGNKTIFSDSSQQQQQQSISLASTNTYSIREIQMKQITNELLAIDTKNSDAMYTLLQQNIDFLLQPLNDTNYYYDTDEMKLLYQNCTNRYERYRAYENNITPRITNTKNSNVKQILQIMKDFVLSNE